MSNNSLEQRVARLEDRLAITDLVADYCAAIDGRDLEGFVACFTHDGVIRHADGAMGLDGREAIRDYYARRFGEYGMTFHYPHSHTIVIDGPDEAHGTVTAHAEMALQGEAWIAALRYTDRYRRDDGRWRFAERELACWYYMPLSQLAQGLASELRKHYRDEHMAAELPESLATYRAWRGGSQPIGNG
jgi:uncharacterized protein (TIGR02246 family)